MRPRPSLSLKLPAPFSPLSSCCLFFLTTLLSLVSCCCCCCCLSILPTFIHTFTTTSPATAPPTHSPQARRPLLAFVGSCTSSALLPRSLPPGTHLARTWAVPPARLTNLIAPLRLPFSESCLIRGPHAVLKSLLFPSSSDSVDFVIGTLARDLQKTRWDWTAYLFLHGRFGLGTVNSCAVAGYAQRHSLEPPVWGQSGPKLLLQRPASARILCGIDPNINSAHLHILVRISFRVLLFPGRSRRCCVVGFPSGAVSNLQFL